MQCSVQFWSGYLKSTVAKRYFKYVKFRKMCLIIPPVIESGPFHSNFLFFFLVKSRYYD